MLSNDQSLRAPCNAAVVQGGVEPIRSKCVGPLNK